MTKKQILAVDDEEDILELVQFNLFKEGCQVFCAASGNEALKLNLRGKPEPDTFLKAAGIMGIAPARAVVVEDAISGVQAGRKGNFGLVIGIARHGDATALLENGADIVVADLEEFL